MPVTIINPENSYAEERVSLGGIDYRFIYRFNSREQRWRFDIFEDETRIVMGVKAMENQDLTGRYILSRFDHGNIYCVQLKSTDELVSRDNLGLDREFELVYLTTEEEAEIDADIVANPTVIT